MARLSAGERHDEWRRLASGQADDLLATVCLATRAPIAIAPAMNHLMWSNAATRANIATLLQRGVQLLGPAEGDQACGEIGEGRMLEPLDLAERLQALLVPGGGSLVAKVQTMAAPQIGGPFALIDDTGKPRTDADFRGRLMLIYFGYTHCPDACPTALQDMADALAKLGPAADQVAPIFITPSAPTSSVVICKISGQR